MAKIQLEGILKLIDVDINPAIFQKISRAASTLPGAFQKMTQGASNAGGAVEDLTEKVRKTNQQLNLGSAFAQKFLQRMAQFAILLPIFATLNKAIQGGVRFLADFESELLNIARVDPKNAIGKLDQIADAALNIGIQFGASATEVVKTIKVFVQAGESIESSLEKARVATLATQVSTLDLAQAQELLIGVSKQFRNEALSDIDILDKVSKVEDQSAADAAELAEAFVTGGNAVSFATKSFDDAIGLIAALREQTRKSGREIGTFLKTLSTRILAAGDSRTALEQLGVAVENVDGTLRPLMDILRDTKTAFDGLTESEAANAAKAIGGVRQFESLLATLQALDKAQTLSANSASSQGTSLQKLDIVSQKLSLQAQQMVAEFQKLAAVLGEAGVLDFFKEALKAARGFALALQSVVKVADTIGVSLTPLIAAGAFKLGQIAFAGRGAAAGGGTAATPTAAAGTGSLTTNTLAFSQAEASAAAVTSTAKSAKSIFEKTAIQFIATQAAALVVGKAFNTLQKKTVEAGGSLGFMGDTARRFSGALENGLQVGSVLGVKAGIMAGVIDLAIKTLSDLVKAWDESNKATEELAVAQKASIAEIQLRNKIKTDQNFNNTLNKALAGTVARTGGNITGNLFAEMRKELDRTIKQVPANTPGVSQLKGLDLNTIFGDKKFFKAIADANKDFTNLSQALEEGQDPSRLLTAYVKDLGNVAKESGSFVKNFVKDIVDLKSVKKLTELQEQEAQVNALLVERSELLRTDIPLFESEIEAMQRRAIATSKFLDVAGAAKDSLFKLAEQNPSQLGFNQPGEAGSDAAKQFLQSVEKAFNEAGKGGKFGLSELIKTFDKASADDVGSIANAFDQAGVEAATAGEDSGKMLDAAKFFVQELTKGLTEGNKLLEQRQEIDRKNALEVFEFGKTLTDTLDAANKAVGNAQVAFIKMGASADISAQDIDQLSALTLEDFKAIQAGGGDASEALRNLILTLSGNEVQQAEQSARASAEAFAAEISMIDDEMRKVKDDLNATILSGKDNSATTGKSRIELEKELGELQISRINKVSEAEQQGVKDSIDVLKARKSAEEEAIKKAKEMANALDDLANAEFQLKNGTEDAARSFRDFTKQTLESMAQKDAEAQSNLKSAQQEVLSSTESLDSAFRNLKDAIIAFNDTMAAAQVEAGLLGIQMETLQGGLNTISSRVGALNAVFDSAIKDANISLKERIDLEKQLANETLSFLQNARNEIVNAGLEVFGQSPQENAQLQQGIDGLKIVADKLGGSFEAFQRMGPQQFEKISQELLSLPTSFRQSILDALRTLPSTVQIGGFSVEQLQTALGQVGAGVNEQVGLPEIADIMSQEKEQLAKLQELAISDAELQLSQVVTALEQVDLAKTQLEASQIQADRAAEEVVAVREELITENAALEAAAEQRDKLTAQLLKATDNATIRQIEAQAREFAGQVPLFTDISDKLLEVIQSIGGLKSAQFSAEANIPAAGRGWIPNYAGGKLTTREAYGLLRAGAREKRMMPGGAGLAVANTSETIIPSRYRGYIPNFAAGSEIASSIQAVNGVNAAVVAAITNSINNVIARLQQNNPGANEELTRQQLDKLDNILSTLQEISVSNTSIDTAVNTDTGATAQTGTEAVQPIQINVTSNGRNVVQVAGLDNLESSLREGIRKAQQDQSDQLLQPVNSAVEAIFRVLRERGLISSFGQGQ